MKFIGSYFRGELGGDIECDMCRCKPIRVHISRPSKHVALSLAILMLGQRHRLLFDSLPNMVINATVNHGFRVDFFAYLENNTDVKNYIKATL